MKLPTVPDADRDLVVNETFGPTFQGEGPSTGRRARFIRLFGCHLSCTWCDSAHTHDATRYDLTTEQHTVRLDDILGWLAAGPPGLVVITGGEPLLQPRILARLTRQIRDHVLATDIEVETSGTLTPNPDVIDAVTRFTVSPKLAHSGLHRHQRIRPTALRRFAASGKTIWKFVAHDVSDLDEIHELLTAYDLTPVWVTPEGNRQHHHSRQNAAPGRPRATARLEPLDPTAHPAPGEHPRPLTPPHPTSGPTPSSATTPTSYC